MIDGGAYVYVRMEYFLMYHVSSEEMQKQMSGCKGPVIRHGILVWSEQSDAHS